MLEITSLLERAAATPRHQPDVDRPLRRRRVQRLLTTVVSCVVATVLVVVVLPTRRHHARRVEVNTGPPPVSVPTALPPRALAVGDSVMLGAKKVLTEKIPTMTVDAAVSRRFDQAAGVLSFYASHGLLPRIVVVDLGTNDEVTDELFDHVVRAIGPGHRVFFLTVRVPRPWEKATNDALDRGALRWGADVQVLDWRDYAGCHDDWFLRDGFHLEPVGQQAFAQFILDAITGHSGQGGQGGCAATPAATRITSGDAAIDVVSGWYASKEPLAWWLVSPREVFSIATSPLPPSPRKAPNEAACPSEIPQVAVDGIADDGAYLWIGEWHGGLYQADPRPAASNALILAPGCSLPRGEKAYLALLRDGRHDYSVTFVLGKDAPPSRRDDINRMLDSLRFSG